MVFVCRSRTKMSYSLLLSPRDEVRRVGAERDVAAVVAHGRQRAVGVALRPERVDADQRSDAELTVAHEHVALAVGVARNEVRGVRGERDVAAVVADGRQARPSRSLHATARDAHPFRRPGDPVAHEHIRAAVRVGDDEIGREGRERDVAAVAAHGEVELHGIGALDRRRRLRRPHDAGTAGEGRGDRDGNGDDDCPADRATWLRHGVTMRRRRPAVLSNAILNSSASGLRHLVRDTRGP